MKPKLAIWGSGGHALVVADIVRCAGEYELAGILEDGRFSQSMREALRPLLLGDLSVVDGLRSGGVRYAIVAVGDCRLRLEIAGALRAKDLELATAIHPAAVVASDVEVGGGSVIAAGAVVNPGAVIGENVIVNTGATVDHECVLEEGVHISPGAHLAGRVRVGRGSWVGIGAAVRDLVRIGAGSVIGAGAVVVEDIPDHVIAYGIPAKVRRKNEFWESDTADR